jgi:HPt (histidine-containing phosphotransfer) domain-containing protein
MIDWERVAILRDDLGADGVDLVMGIFVEDAQMLLAKIAAAGTAAAQEADLHRLRGGSLNVGCAGLAEACRRHELAARAGDMMPDADSEALRRLFDLSVAALADQAANPQAASGASPGIDPVAAG